MFDKKKGKTVAAVKYVVFVRNNDLWDVYTSRRDEHETEPWVETKGAYERNVKLPVKLFGIDVAPWAGVLRDKDDCPNLIWVNQRYLGVNINQLPK